MKVGAQSQSGELTKLVKSRNEPFIRRAFPVHVLLETESKTAVDDAYKNENKTTRSRSILLDYKSRSRSRPD